MVALGVVNFSLRISTVQAAPVGSLGMNHAGAQGAVHLRPRSQPALRPAIENDAPIGPNGAPTAPGLIHRSLDIMDSCR